MNNFSNQDTVPKHERLYPHGILQWLSNAISYKQNRNKYDIYVNGNVYQNGSRIHPVGEICFTATSSAPNGAIMCQGQAVSRSTYSELFSVIGTSYGVGDGSTTFNLPNAKGKVLIGQDTSQTEFNVIGETGGHKMLQNHAHLEYSDNTQGSQVPYMSDGASGPSTTGVYGGWSGSTQVASKQIYTGSTGDGNSQNLQPYQVIGGAYIYY